MHFLSFNLLFLSSRQAFSKARQLDPRPPMPSLPLTCICSTIITGFLSLRIRSRDCAAVIRVQHAVRDASAALARHADHVAARHIPRNSHLAHPVRGSIVVWYVCSRRRRRLRLDSLLPRSKRLGYRTAEETRRSIISELLNIANE